MDISKLRVFLRRNLGDMTFAEAYKLTGRVFNVSVLSTQNEPALLLNYLTSPTCLVWSAACASCALPGLFEPVELMAKRGDRIEPYHPSALQYSDGSMEHDLPMQRVSELFNVNNFIVSQVNPHVLPFVDPVQTSPRFQLSVNWFWRSAKWFLYSEVRHRLLQLAHFVPLTRSVTKFVTQDYLGGRFQYFFFLVLVFISSYILLSIPIPPSYQYS